jgi:hypothetical protein
MKKIILLMAIYICFSITAIAGDSSWTPVQGFEHNMIVFGKLFVNDVFVQSEDYIIAAFDDLNICKGKSAIKQHDTNVNFYMTIASSNSHPIYFKVLNKKDGTEYKIFDTIQFKADTTIADKVLKAF